MVMILSNYTKIMEETYAAFEKEKVLGGIFDISEIVANQKIIIFSVLNGDTFLVDPLVELRKVETFLGLPKFFSEEHFKPGHEVVELGSHR